MVGKQPIENLHGSDSKSDSNKSFPSLNIFDFTIKPILTLPQKSTLKSTPKPKLIASIESSLKRKKPPLSGSNGDAGNVKILKTPQLWSAADEIALLKGIMEYKLKKGSDPYEDSSEFMISSNNRSKLMCPRIN
ncbi:Uncharacterized protein TCM_007789 [Theobroma cacao]|uniref:Glabrous enhancer-binding protein-like DBD domain-containing protein n=1 Tax=Theobroma cacao TaxID=3641 RepID=A0A061E2G7_THECC|nr:Uncharacterized protein TCM_007789 [Theobroma cacao]